MLSSVSIYKNVLDKCSYEDYFKKLKAHGNVKKSYFHPISYKNHFSDNYRTNNIVRERNFENRQKRWDIHYKGENEYPNLNSVNAIDGAFEDCPKESDYGFKYQKPKNLVYCNLIEHAILHLLIVKENYPRIDLGFDGYLGIKGRIRDKYVDPSDLDTKEEFIKLLSIFYDFIESLGNSPENNLSKQDKKSTSSKLTPKETLLKRDRKNNRTILKDENGKLDKDYKEILIKTNKYETLLGKKLDWKN